MFRPVRLDQLSDPSVVAGDGTVQKVDLGHSLHTVSGPTAQGVRCQLAQEPAAGRSPAFSFDIDRPEEIVGQRDHHFGHEPSIPGNAKWLKDLLTALTDAEIGDVNKEGTRRRRSAAARGDSARPAPISRVSALTRETPAPGPQLPNRRRRR